MANYLIGLNASEQVTSGHLQVVRFRLTTCFLLLPVFLLLIYLNGRFAATQSPLKPLAYKHFLCLWSRLQANRCIAIVTFLKLHLLMMMIAFKRPLEKSISRLFHLSLSFSLDRSQLILGSQTLSQTIVWIHSFISHPNDNFKSKSNLNPASQSKVTISIEQNFAIFDQIFLSASLHLGLFTKLIHWLKYLILSEIKTFFISIHDAYRAAILLV